MKTLKKYGIFTVIVLIAVTMLVFATQRRGTYSKAISKTAGSFIKDAVNYKALTPQPPTEFDSLQISDPVGHRNLQIFIISSKKESASADYITLSEAIEKRVVKVHETGSVNQLAITNSSDNYIFIHSGDIVKGGKQDRTISDDMLIPPRAKNMPLESFCVESGRWQKRGTEKADQFSSNSAMLSSRKLKIAARHDKNQSAVWSNVAEQQNKLNENISKMNGENIDVRSNRSATSLQLTLENKELEKIMKEFIDKFNALPVDKKNTVGFAYAVNGEVYGIDIYYNHALFSELWNKLLNSAIVEAISDMDKQEPGERADVEDVVELMKQPPSKNNNKRNINDETELMISEDDDIILFETRDKENRCLHKNYIKQDKNEPDQDNNTNQRIYNNNDLNNRINTDQEQRRQ